MNKRTAIASLFVSASALVGLVVHEGYTDSAIIPTKGDRATVGYGMTFHSDGSPVKLGDTTTPVKALQRTLAYIQKDETRIKQCVTAPLHQIEYDTLLNFSYQYGITRLCNSSMVKLANQGDYIGSCKAYLQYRFAAGYDCSTLYNGQKNKRCWGVYSRQLERYEACMSVQ